ncbi:YtxH domain-containing protein [Trichlorobacter ammonificans]|uniref:Gas vesicle protein n=1 Tax=Trichlorobacter ammonificans TaxID=2916410 RepID=A0ABM9D540_9BACT|nr:YtxH domain-containing protein [Trichlorobacter ammonificans]CAH2030331.1 Gas vesicle protein [Trichlorobacter ammonificans]
MAHEDNGVSASTVLVSFLAGAALGAGLAMLYAPKDGRQLRNQIADLADDAVDKIKEYAKEAQEKIKETIDEGKDVVAEKKSILSSALEAGREAIKREKEKYSA